MMPIEWLIDDVDGTLLTHDEVLTARVHGAADGRAPPAFSSP